MADRLVFLILIPSIKELVYLLYVSKEKVKELKPVNSYYAYQML